MMRFLAAAAAGLLLAAPLAAQSPSHVYTFNGDLSDSQGTGENMTSYGGSLLGGQYVFGAGQGLSLKNALSNMGTYSIEMLFQLTTESGYRKRVDFKGRTSDNGVYTFNGTDDFYNVGTGSPATGVVHSIITRDATSNLFNMYINGAQSITFTDGSSLATFSSPDMLMYFMMDDGVQGTEQSGGSLNYIRIYDEALSSEQVAARYSNYENELAGVDQGGNGGNTVTPEPVSMVLLGTGLAGVAGARRRRKAMQSA